MSIRLCKFFQWTAACWLAALAACPTASAAATKDINVTARFSPPQLGAGSIGAYEVTVSGSTSAPAIDPPNVAGLEVMGSAQGSKIQIVNGDMTAEFSKQFQIRARQPGNYTIPSYEIIVNGNAYTVPAATLQVSERPPPPPGADTLVNLAAKAPRTDIYVGEKLPLDLTVTWRPDLQPQIAGEFTQDNDAFERVGLSGKPEDFSVPMNGQRYNGDTWHTTLTPLKAGPQSLHFTLPLMVMVPGQTNDPFTASLLGSGLMLSAHQEQVSVVSTPLDFNVQALPDAGKPANFSGGIGVFSLDPPTVDSTDLQVGVPVTYKLTVNGQGNFDRLQAPTLDLGTLWHSYPPQDSFKALDSLNYKGVKTFEYVLMPMSENITQLPAPKFSYFNPDTKSYIEIPVKPIEVKVRPAPPGQSAAPLPAVTSAPAGTGRSTDLIPLHIDAGAWQSPQRSALLSSPYFWAAQALPALVLAGFVFTRRRQLRLENDPAYARRLRSRQQAHAAVERARTAAAKGGAADFYTEAQRALQAAASHDRRDAAEALTWQEFDAHLAARGTAFDLRQQARQIFEAGDALRFGGFAPDQADLAEAAKNVDNLVKKLLNPA